LHNQKHNFFNSRRAIRNTKRLGDVGLFNFFYQGYNCHFTKSMEVQEVSILRPIQQAS